MPFVRLPYEPQLTFTSSDVVNQTKKQYNPDGTPYWACYLLGSNDKWTEYAALTLARTMTLMQTGFEYNGPLDVHPVVEKIREYPQG